MPTAFLQIPFPFTPPLSQGSTLIISFCLAPVLCIGCLSFSRPQQTRPTVPICHCPAGIPEASGPPGAAALSGEARPPSRGSGVWKPGSHGSTSQPRPLSPKAGWSGGEAPRLPGRLRSLKSQPVSQGEQRKWQPLSNELQL